MAKEKDVQIATPVGIIIGRPYISSPDTEYDKDGIYHFRLKFEPDEIVEIADQIKSIYSDWYKECLEEKGKKKLMEAPFPVFNFEDEEGNETEDIVLKFKQNAQAKGKDGKIYKFCPTLFDAKKNRVKNVDIWGGSKVRVIFKVRKYFTAVGVGVRLAPVSVRIIDLVTGGNSNPWQDHEDEEGYEHSEDDCMSDSANEESQKVSADELDF